MTDRQLERLLQLVDAHLSGAPIVVGIDGRSGAGKSTLAAAMASALDAHGSALVIEGDEFYAGGDGRAWDERSAAEKAEQVIDWQRQRAVLDELRATGRSSWRPCDWEADGWDGDPPPFADPVDADIADVVILEGAYSCRPELHDLLDLRVLLATPKDERRRRLLGREGDEYRSAWEQRWSEAEDHYFGVVMTPDRFDLVL